MRRATILALALLAGNAVTIAAQQNDRRPTNLKFFPQNISMQALRDTMGQFTRALGVRCNHCHLQRPGEGFDQINYALDDKPEKQKAREMLRMVAAINNDHLSKLTDRKQPAVGVSCMTCHRGVVEPRPLQQLVLTAYDAAGADSAEKVYRNLRQRYYGRAAYDFGEVGLADVGAVLRERGQLKDAVRFHSLNTEFLPNSAFAHRAKAEAQLAAADTTGAIASLERVLAINANDGQARRALEALRRR